MAENYNDCAPCEQKPEKTGYVSSVDQAVKLISSFEKKNTVKFSCYKDNGNFGNHGESIFINFWLNCALIIQSCQLLQMWGSNLWNNNNN